MGVLLLSDTVCKRPSVDSQAGSNDNNQQIEKINSMDWVVSPPPKKKWIRHYLLGEFFFFFCY